MRQLTNSSGVVTDTFSYDGFGVTLTRTGTTPNVYMYRGEQYDPDLGLYYLRARYYNSLTGRFLSRDPENGRRSDPDSLHKYLYAGGDPVNASDPTGRDLLGRIVLSWGVISAASNAKEVAQCVWTIVEGAVFVIQNVLAYATGEAGPTMPNGPSLKCLPKAILDLWVPYPFSKLFPW